MSRSTENVQRAWVTEAAELHVVLRTQCSPRGDGLDGMVVDVVLLVDLTALCLLELRRGGSLHGKRRRPPSRERQTGGHELLVQESAWLGIALR